MNKIHISFIKVSVFHIKHSQRLTFCINSLYKEYFLQTWDDILMAKNMESVTNKSVTLLIRSYKYKIK